MFTVHFKVRTNCVTWVFLILTWMIVPSGKSLFKYSTAIIYIYCIFFMLFFQHESAEKLMGGMEWADVWHHTKYSATALSMIWLQYNSMWMTNTNDDNMCENSIARSSLHPINDRVFNIVNKFEFRVGWCGSILFLI